MYSGFQSMRASARLFCWVAPLAAWGLTACQSEVNPLQDHGPLRPDLTVGEAPELRSGYYWIEGVLQKVTYQDTARGRVYEGDILLRPAQEVSKEDADIARGLAPPPEQANHASQAVFAVPAFALWPDGVVPYTIEEGLPQAAAVAAAIERIESKTGVRIVPRTDEETYVPIVAVNDPDFAGVCAAYVGYFPGELSGIFLSPECDTPAIVHEFGHVLGLWHEHTRFDRDDHIVVNWDYLHPDGFSQIQKRLDDGTARLVGPYDLDSIMHYSSFAFSRVRGVPTMVRKSDGTTWGRPTELSSLDVEGLNFLYKGSSGPGPGPDDGELLCNDSYCRCLTWPFITDPAECLMFCEGGDYYYGYGGPPACAPAGPSDPP